jgi:hypothetical protein
MELLMLFKYNRSSEPAARKPRFTQVKLIAAAVAVIGLALTAAGGMASAATQAKTCKDVVLFAYIESRGDRMASVPFRVRPCGNQHPGSWTTSVSSPTTTAPGDVIGWVLQGMDIRLEGVGNNSKASSAAHYKGVAKLTQKTVYLPLVPLAPTSLRSITVAIRFTVVHQKGGGNSRNVNLPNLIKVDGTWSSHPEWVKFTYKKGGYVR